MPEHLSLTPNVIYVHSLRGSDHGQVGAFIARLEELSVMALGGPEAIASVTRPVRWPPATPEDPPSVERRMTDVALVLPGLAALGSAYAPSRRTESR